MVVRDADPETIARFTQPPRASKTTAPVVDALDQHMRSSKGMVMGQSFGASGPIAMGAAAPGGSRPGSAKPAIFAGGSGGHSRPVSKQQQRHKIACDAVWPDGPPAEPATPQPGAASLGMSGGLGQGRVAAAAGRRGAPAEIPDEFAALGLGSGPSGNGARAVAGGLGGPAGGIGLGGGNALASGGGVPGRRIQGMPFPDATAPMGGGKPPFTGAAPTFTPSFMAQAEALKKQSGSILAQYSGTGTPAPGGGYQGFNPISNVRASGGGGIFR